MGSHSDGVAEYWNASGASFQQTVSLPAGLYSLATRNRVPEHFSVQFISPGAKDIRFGLHSKGASGNWLPTTSGSTTTDSVIGLTDVQARVAAICDEAAWTYVKNADPVDDARFDLIFLLTNPNLDAFPKQTQRANVPGWYSDQTGGNSQTMVTDAATGEDGTKTHFFEYWTQVAKANGECALYQNVTLPAGTYDIHCYAFAQDQYAGRNSVGVRSLHLQMPLLPTPS